MEDVFGEAVAGLAGRRRRDVFVDEVGKRELAAVGAEQGDVEIFRRHEAAHDAVHLGKQGREVAAGEDGAGNLKRRALHLVAATALGDVDGDGELAGLAAELDDIGVDEERGETAVFRAEVGLEIAHEAVGGNLREKFGALHRVSPEIDIGGWCGR